MNEILIISDCYKHDMDKAFTEIQLISYTCISFNL